MMIKMRTAGHAGVSCTLLLLCLEVCLATITVTVLPKVEVIKGEMARLPCSYTASEMSGITVVQWFIETAGTRQRITYRSGGSSGVDKDTPFSDRVSMESDLTLVIKDVTAYDERSFYCQVTSGPAGAKEAETKLSVFYAPEKPVSNGNIQSLAVNQETQQEVGVCTSRNGFPEPRIIWFKNDKPLAEVKDRRENTYMVPRVIRESSGLFTVSSTLYMKLVKEDTKAEFHCTVEHQMPNGTNQQQKSDKFRLSLLYPSENAFFTLLNQSPVKEGDDVQMKCETDGNPQPPFEFFKNQKESLPASNTAILTLKSVTRNSAGTYMCQAVDFDNLEADLTKTLQLVVHYLDPVSVTPAGPILVKKGDRVELQCKTKSSDTFTQSWTKDKKLLSQKDSLVLESVTLADAGEYVCAASVSSVPGLMKQASVNITVSGAPEIETPITAEVGKEGEMVTVMCSALGYPSPQFTWTPSGQESVEIKGNKYISKNSLKATAEILKNGIFCEAANAHGQDSKKIHVQLKSANTIDGNRGGQAESQQGGSSSVVIAVVVCVLLLLLLVALLYFLSKKGKMSCGKEGKKEVTSGAKSGGIVVEMKNDDKTNEDSVPLKQPHADQ